MADVVHHSGQPDANRLGASAGLYLRQHAANPVHWQPWDDQAFDRARTEDKPILLSIGYAACHWCHVMARESFADPATAAVMNALFVCIKVDREERPDLDRFYLSAMAQMGKAAGWPLTAFLAPDAAPFGGGGYFPPEPRFGLPAFTDVLQEAASSYRSGSRLELPIPAPRVGSRDSTLSEALLDRVSRVLADGVDGLYGGFGMNGPKFLHAAGHELLLRAWDRTGEPSYLETVAASVARISGGAVFDHVGGGYHRYAVDDRWHVPHFEKMLNDNGLMIRLCTQLWQATGGTMFAARVEATIGWLMREMRLPSGAFASSLAADSGPGNAEGAFYLWTQAELDDALGGKLLTVFEAVTDDRLDGRYALTRPNAAGDWTEVGAIGPGLAALQTLRDRRPAPLRDDKCLADWNGLTIMALAEAGLAFGRADWVTEAGAVFAAVLDEVASGPGLAHCAADGVRSAAGLLDDYASMMQAALTLYEATGDRLYLDRALGWEHVLETQFWDEEAGGYFLTATDAERRIPRQKFIDESASPAGNGIMLAVLARLHAATGRDRFRHRFEGILRCFADRLSRAGLQAATALCQSQALEHMVQIVVVGDGDRAGLLRRAAARPYVPDHLLVAVTGRAELPEGHPAQGKTAGDAGAAAYVCLGARCLPPACTAGTLADRLSRASRRSP